MTNITVTQLIATLILASCDAHAEGVTSQDDWTSEQTRLWRLAAARGITSDVARLIAPAIAAGR